MLVKEIKQDNTFIKLFEKTILNNKFIPNRIKKGICNYPQEIILLQQANEMKKDPITGKIGINDILCGGARFGGKTLMGAVLALQYMMEPSYKCLVTRRLYDDLMAEGTDSIFGYIKTWKNELQLTDKELEISMKYKHVKSEYGAIINFRAFNYDKKGDSLQSKSNKRIINDEAPQLSLSLIEDQYPTLRQQITDKFPLSIINFGNPQLNNEEVNNYFGDTYIKGDKPYINMDLHTNPLIDRESYKGSFTNLSTAKKEAFLHGNFFYKPTEGDLITQAQLNNALFDTSIIDYRNTSSLLFIDLAGRGTDKFAITTFTIDFQRNIKIIDNITQTIKANASKEVHNHIQEDRKRGIYPSIAILEMEGGSWIYTYEYWQEIFLQYDILADDQRPNQNKYIRALPLSDELIAGETVINQDLAKKIYIESKHPISYFEIFSGEMISMLPIMKVSPNIVDTCSLGVNYCNNNEIVQEVSIKRCQNYTSFSIIFYFYFIKISITFENKSRCFYVK